MNPETLESFVTGTRKVTVELVSWHGSELGLKISDGSTNFTSFSVDSRGEGQMKGRFIAAAFQKAIKAAKQNGSDRQRKKTGTRSRKSRIDRKRCVHGHKLGTPAGDMHRSCARKGTV